MSQSDFQDNCADWVKDTFGEEKAANVQQRSWRFLEEALELGQSVGISKEEAYQLVDYVFGRPIGEVSQELGGTMTTLAALSEALGLCMITAGQVELERCRVPEIQEKIRRKEATKPLFSALPGSSE